MLPETSMTNTWSAAPHLRPSLQFIEAWFSVSTICDGRRRLTG
jgi:hypothetical protein